MALFIVSAPSGSGKSTLVRELFQNVAGLQFSVSYTTRAPRGSEQNGREYFFVTREQFQAMIARRDFLEHAEVFGNLYGTSRQFLEEAERRGQDLVLDIDVQGARQVKRQLPAAVSIFIAPPDRDTLAWRLRHRAEDSGPVIEQRLADASREIEAYNGYDYVVVNGELRESVDKLCAIVRCQRQPNPRDCAVAEACRQANVAAQLHPVLRSFGLTA